MVYFFLAPPLEFIDFFCSPTFCSDIPPLIDNEHSPIFKIFSRINDYNFFKNLPPPHSIFKNLPPPHFKFFFFDELFISRCFQECMTKTLQEVHQFCNILLLGFVIPFGHFKKNCPPPKKNKKSKIFLLIIYMF